MGLHQTKKLLHNKRELSAKWEEIFVKHVSGNGLITQQDKNSNSPIKKWAEELSRHFIWKTQAPWLCPLSQTSAFSKHDLDLCWIINHLLTYLMFFFKLIQLFQNMKYGRKEGSVSCSVVSDSAIPWSVPHQAPLSMGFSRQEYWSRLSFSSPGDLPNPGIEPGSPVLQVDSLPPEPLC